MKRTICLIALFLAACSPTPKGAPVPIKQLFAENAGKLWECAEFDAGDNTCEALGKRAVRGDRVAYDAMAVLPKLPGIPGRAKMNMAMRFKIEGDAYCGRIDPSRIRVTGVPASIAADLTQSLKVEMVKQGEICTRYYRDGPGQYIGVTTQRDGSPVDDGIAPVRFFANAPGLRSVSLF